MANFGSDYIYCLTGDGNQFLIIDEEVSYSTALTFEDMIIRSGTGWIFVCYLVIV